MNSFHQMEDIQIDALKEVGNIGTGNAMTALSAMLNRPINMKVPKVELLSFEQITASVGGDEAIVVGIYLKITGDLQGSMLFIIPKKSAHVLFADFLQTDHLNLDRLDEYEQSALTEIGNILAGSYLSALADFTNLHVTQSIPAIAIDMAAAILSFGLIEAGQIGEQVLWIDTEFNQQERAIRGHFFLILEPASFESLFQSLGVSS